MKKLLIFTLSIFFCVNGFAQEYSFGFTTGEEGWIANFADYPAGEEVFYELDFQWSPLPNPLDTNQNSLFITGINHSDDLFMYIKKNITGLLPNTAYTVTFDIEFASIYPTNAVGVGGAPGEGVTMKAGVTLVEPISFIEDDTVFINIDKGNQTNGGIDMDVIGHVGVADDTTEYTLITNNNFPEPFAITTDSNGEVWLIIGTDSGFEATTALYYNQIDVVFTHNINVSEDKMEKEFTIYPNPSTGCFSINNNHNILKLALYGIKGQLIQTINKPKEIIHYNLPSGVYSIKVHTKKDKVFYKKLIVN